MNIHKPIKVFCSREKAFFKRSKYHSFLFPFIRSEFKVNKRIKSIQLRNILDIDEVHFCGFGFLFIQFTKGWNVRTGIAGVTLCFSEKLQHGRNSLIFEIVWFITNIKIKFIRLCPQTSVSCIMNFNIDKNHNKI